MTDRFWPKADASDPVLPQSIFLAMMVILGEPG
jgi:hypothetical protein